MVGRTKPHRDPTEGSYRSTLFYATDDVFRDAMVRFVEGGLDAGESVITISTNDHRAAILDLLAASAVDVRGAFACDQLLMLDAREILCAVVTQDRPSPDRFDAIITKMIHRVASRRAHKPIRVFSEMIDLLARSERAQAADEVDALWENLAQKRGFTLLSARLVGPRDPARPVTQSGERARVRAPQEPAAVNPDRARDDTVATISHELRTPLNAILAFATLLETKDLDDEARNAVLSIARNAHIQARLIDDLRDASLVAAGKLTLDVGPIDLVDVVRDALDVVGPAAREKSVSVTVRHRAATEPILGDGARLVQVVWNLVANAVKFSHHGGEVEVRLARAADAVTLTVADCGSGIDPAFLPHAFERFRQGGAPSSRRGGGLGLGLAISKELVLLHGGTILAASDGLGKGATFTVTLPVGRP